MKTKLLIICGLISIISVSQTPEFEWVGTYTSSKYVNAPNLCEDNAGNVIVTLTNDQTINFDLNSNSTQYLAYGNQHLIIQNLSTTGQIIWEKILSDPIQGDTGTIFGFPFINANGDICIIGNFTKSVDFDPGPGTHILTTNSKEMYLLKLTQSGNFIDVNIIANAENISGYGAFYTASNELILYGGFEDTISFESTSGAQITLPTQGNRDGFVVNLNDDLKVNWHYCIGGIGLQEFSGVDQGPDGSYYFTGAFHGVVDFDFGSGTYNMSSQQDNDLFLLKLDADGLFQLASQSLALSQFGFSTGFDIKVDQNDDIIILGAFAGDVDFDPGHNYNLTAVPNTPYSDIAIVKYDASGDLIWAKKIGGYFSDIAINLDLDDDGNMIFSGWYAENADLDPSPTNSLSSSYSSPNSAFIEKLDSDGELLWVLEIGGNSGYTTSLRMITASNNDIYISGNYNKTLDVDPSTNTYIIEPYSTTSGTYDAFLLKLNQIYLGNSQEDIIHSISVSPNPTSNFININNFVELEQNLTYQILNTNGEFITTDQAISPNIDVSSLTAGIYFIQFLSEQQVFTTRFIVE